MADVSVLNAFSFTPDAPPSGSLTIGAGAGNRALVLMYGAEHDISAFGWTITTVTVGGIAPTLNYKTGDSTDDCPRFIGIWDEADIDAMTGTSVVWTASSIVDEFWGYGVYDDVDQTDLSAVVKDATNLSAAQSTITLTTTSNDGDRIIVVAILRSGARNWTDWDTLTELYDTQAASTNTKYGAGEGNGGDDSSVITNTTVTVPNGASIVLPAAGGGANPMMMKMMQEGHLNG